MCVVSLCVLTTVETVNAQAPAATNGDTVQSLFAEGTAAFDGGRYDAALVAFKSAYAIRAVPEILYMVGRSYELNRNYREALNTYRQVHGHAGVSKKTSGYAADGIIKLEALFPSEYTLSVTYQPVSAVLEIDGIQIGSQGRAKLKKKPGQYDVKLAAEGFRPYEGAIDLAASSQMVLSLDAIPPPPKFIAPPVPPTHWKQPAGWVAIAFGALAGGAGSLFLLQAQDNADAANNATIGTTYDSHKEAAEFNESMAFGHYGAALVGVGLGVLWLATAADGTPLNADVSAVEQGSSP